MNKQGTTRFSYGELLTTSIMPNPTSAEEERKEYYFYNDYNSMLSQTQQPWSSASPTSINYPHQPRSLFPTNNPAFHSSPSLHLPIPPYLATIYTATPSLSPSPQPLSLLEEPITKQKTTTDVAVSSSQKKNNNNEPRTRGRRVSKVVHQDTRAFCCKTEGCGKVFKRSEHLKRHIRSIHTMEKPFKCPYQNCNKRFSRSDNLNQHIRIHRHCSNRASTTGQKSTNNYRRSSNSSSSGCSDAMTLVTGTPSSSSSSTSTTTLTSSSTSTHLYSF
ncbi:MAG: hypothetical protein EXX96DRAFT_544251 [Benjaminiella poitrasii]|nr:MAG: hypothetical protein EXX96DRAFT_544251 [Benjaminiella poitrasii]